MRILNRNDIMETIGMLTDENLDVRTVTMGISLLDCIDPDGEKACEKIYNKITRLAGSLVSTVDSISSEYGIPIVNKRISVTPIAMLLGAAPVLTLYCTPKRWTARPRPWGSTSSAASVRWYTRAFPRAISG